MKKVLLLIISVVSVLHAYAQNVDSLQVQSASITIDSLSLKLDKLQHDYDFMSCDYELYRLKMELNDLSQDINIKTNGVLIDINHSRYDRELYTALSNNYDACCALYDSLKEKFEHVKTLVILKLTSSQFSETELGLISASFDSIHKSVAAVDAALNYYDTAIRTYKSKRW